MSLGIPGKVVDVAANGLVATLDTFGEHRVVRLLVEGPVAPGDYLLSDFGYAVQRIPEHEIEATLARYQRWLHEASDVEADEARVQQYASVGE
jgi:hydrogenase assembly chaperone HypC/HupF